MLSTITLNRASDTPLYRQIGDQLKAAIAEGKLPAGAQLPTVRQLAAELGVTRLTVQSAYAELQSSGWIEATVGRGTFVSAQVAMQPRWSAVNGAATPATVIGDILQMGQVQGMRSLASASPDPDLFPAAEFWASLEAQRDHVALVGGYGPAQGDAALRIELAAHLSERGIEVTPDDVLVVAGVTQGVALAAQALAQPGDYVLVERPTYVGFLHQLRAYGLQPLAAPVDADGPVLEVVEQLATQQRIRFFYTIPSFQNPTGSCMSPARRERLLELAERYDFLIVEDDLYGWLAYEEAPLPPLKAADASQRVIYVTSFSKTLMPGLRLGMLAPPPALRQRLTALRIAADLGSPLLLQRALAAFLQRGNFRRHLRRTLPVYRQRRNAALRACEAFMPAGVQWTRPRGGLCCWLTLPPHPAMADVPRLALQQGWAVAPGSVFLPDATAQHHLRICFGALPEESIRRGVEVVAQVIRQQLADAPPSATSLDAWMPLL